MGGGLGLHLRHVLWDEPSCQAECLKVQLSFQLVVQFLSFVFQTVLFDLHVIILAGCVYDGKAGAKERGMASWHSCPCCSSRDVSSCSPLRTYSSIPGVTTGRVQKFRAKLAHREL